MLHSVDCSPTVACGGNWHDNSITSEEHHGQLIVWDQLLTATLQGSLTVTNENLGFLVDRSDISVLTSPGLQKWEGSPQAE